MSGRTKSQSWRAREGRCLPHERKKGGARSSSIERRPGIICDWTGLPCAKPRSFFGQARRLSYDVSADLLVGVVAGLAFVLAAEGGEAINGRVFARFGSASFATTGAVNALGGVRQSFESHGGNGLVARLAAAVATLLDFVES